MSFQSDFDSQLNEKLRELLTSADYGGEMEGKEWIRKIRCPSCGEPEAFAHAETPYVICCPRKNKCGISIPAKEFAPHLFQDFSKRFPPTKENPNRTAEAYLHSRRLPVAGFDWKQTTWKENGWKCQAVAIRSSWTPDCWWLRLIDLPPQAKGKVRWQGGNSSFSGQAWRPQGMVKPTEELWLTEGIFETLSLEKSNIQSAACLSSSHIPEDFLKELLPEQRLVVALNNDPAGRKGAHKLLAWLKDHGFQDVAVALPPEGKDWNDLLQAGELEEDQREQTLKEAKWRGRLFQAGSVAKYREIYQERHSSTDGFYHEILEFRGRTYHCGTKTEGSGENRRTVGIETLVLEGTLRRAYTQLKEDREFEPEHETFVEVTPLNGKKRVIRLNADELVRGHQLKPALKRKADILLRVSSETVLNSLITHIEKQRAPVIRLVNRLGFDPESGCYLFGKFLYDSEGKRHEANGHGFFEKQGLRCKTSDPLHTEWEAIDLKKVLELIYQMYGANGIFVFGFYVATLLKTAIMEEEAAFPFLSLTGSNGSGKTTLLEFLHNAFFQKGLLGIDANEKSSHKSVSRKLWHRHSLVIPYNESNHKLVGLTEDGLKTAYNGGSLYDRAAYSNDAETISLPFDAALAFNQNFEPFRSRAVIERIVSFRFWNAEEGGVTQETLEAAEELKRMNASQRAGIGHIIFQNLPTIRDQVLSSLDGTQKDFLSRGIVSPRIAFNHAVIAEATGALLAVAGITNEQGEEWQLAEKLLGTAKLKETDRSAINDTAAQFIEIFETLKTEGIGGQEQPHSVKFSEHYLEDENYYYLRVEEIVRVARLAGYNLQSKEIRSALQAAENIYVSYDQKRSVGNGLRWSEGKKQRFVKIRKPSSIEDH